MRNYVLTENERKILMRWLESGEELAGYPLLKNRILNNFGTIIEDVKLVAEYIMKIEDRLPPEAQSQAVEVRKWLLSYLSKTAPELAPDIGRVSERYVQQAALLSVAVDNAPDAMVVADRGGVRALGCLEIPSPKHHPPPHQPPRPTNPPNHTTTINPRPTENSHFPHNTDGQP